MQYHIKSKDDDGFVIIDSDGRELGPLDSDWAPLRSDEDPDFEVLPGDPLLARIIELYDALDGIKTRVKALRDDFEVGIPLGFVADYLNNREVGLMFWYLPGCGIGPEDADKAYNKDHENAAR